MTRCRKAGFTKRSSGTLIGCCDKHGKIPLSPDRIKEINEALDAVMEKVPTGRWGYCESKGVPLCVEIRNENGRGDQGSALRANETDPGMPEAWRLFGLLDPAAVCELMKLAGLRNG